MCGIACITNAAGPLGESQLQAMDRVLAAMAYRGPDASGIWEDGRVLLGHRRLSIIDLSEAGTQPLHDLRRDTHIVFNGEIFNYRDLRRELEGNGYAFVTRTDTETILASYAVHGRNAFHRLNGMFAFILYDRRENRLILCRDRMGKKPLYYRLDGGRFAAFSEIKFFHALRDLPVTLDPESVRAFLALQYVPGPETIYLEIRQVPPGHWLEVDLETWSESLHRYWSIEDCFARPSEQAPSIESLDRCLEDSVRQRLVSDVPMGALLSGGIDSSLIAAYARHLTEAPLTGFVVRFDDQDLDESPFARQVALALRMPLVELDGGKVDPDVLQRVVYHADQPLGDPACVPTFLIHEEIARHVKVVLSGEGADELFWGYPRYQREMLFQRLSPLLPPRLFAGDASWLMPLENAPRPPGGLSRLAKVLAAPIRFGCARWATLFSEPALSRLLKPLPAGERGVPRFVLAFEAAAASLQARTTPIEASLATDLLFWLPDDLLAKVDRMSMAHGVEARAPFLAHPVVRLALRLPPHQKADPWATKKILRAVLARKLPPRLQEAIVSRGKHGFDVPLTRWLRQELRDMAEELFSAASLRRYPLLSAPSARALWEAFVREKKPSTAYARKIWVLLSFLSWLRWHERRFDL